jgi:hypothetical protein
MNNRILASLGLISALFLGFWPGTGQAACTIQVAAKNTSGDFIPGVRFEIYEQARDINSRWKPGKLLGSGVTDKILGSASINLSAATTTYAVRAQSVVKDFTSFWFYGQKFDCGSTQVRYLSGIKFIFRDGGGTLKHNVSFDLYTQKYDNDNRPIKDKKDLIGNFNTGEAGQIIVYVPQGSVRSIDGKISDSYVIESKINTTASFVKYDIEVLDAALTESEYIFSDLKLILKDAAGNLMPDKTVVDVYQQLKDVDNNYRLGTKLSSFAINSQGYGLFVYPPGTYALTVKDRNDSKKIYRIWDINLKEGVRTSKTATLNVLDQYNPGGSLASRLKGYIVLQTESHGEAWYINPRDSKRYYLKDGTEAYKIMSRLGYGITNAGLNKIKTGFLSQVVYKDSDNDQLPDKIEESFGTNVNQADTDNDNYFDGAEIRSGYNPNGAGKLPIDLNFSNQQKGKILLQVEKQGQAWYVDPRDGRRYYMADGESAYGVMRYLGLGITNEDLENISIGQF